MKTRMGIIPAAREILGTLLDVPAAPPNLGPGPQPHNCGLAQQLEFARIPPADAEWCSLLVENMTLRAMGSAGEVE